MTGVGVELIEGGVEGSEPKVSTRSVQKVWSVFLSEGGKILETANHAAGRRIYFDCFRFGRINPHATRSCRQGIGQRKNTNRTASLRIVCGEWLLSRSRELGHDVNEVSLNGQTLLLIENPNVAA